MLQDYKNIDSILVTTEPTRGERLDEKDLLVLKYENTTPTFNANEGELLEMHVYDIDGNYITSNHNAEYKKEKPKSVVSDSTVRSYYFDIHQAVRDLELLSGEYKFSINTYRNIVGSFDGYKLALTEISPTRKEIRLKPVDDFSNYASGFDLLNNINDVDFLVNFGNDITATAVNWLVDGSTDTETTIVIRLYDTLSDDIDLGDECWIVDEVSTPYIDNIKVIGAPVPVLQNTIQGPNFDVVTDYRLKTETDFKTWNQLLGSGVSTSQQIIDRYFSGSLSGIKLNIDYCEFENFVHFSSAEERIKNFKYKIELIEQYDARLAELNNTSGSTGGNINITTQKKNDVISGFDDFENYLYFQSGSGIYTFQSCSIHPWPKQPSELVTPLTWQQMLLSWQNANSQWSQGGLIEMVAGFKPYTLYSSTSSIATDWYNSAIASASLYDKYNDSALVKTVPEHIRTDSDNEQYDVFVNMMGHHFDILWSYISHLNKTITREEHFNAGMPDDLLFNVAKSMGWNLSLGNNTEDLWDYTLGTNEAGGTQQTGSLESKSREQVSKEIWRRVVNNLPHLLKTKGTARSVKALLACYGIPQTLLSIREYGGPKLPISEKKPVFIKDDFSYALRLNGVDQYIETKWLPVKTGSYKTPDSIELRFKTQDSSKYVIDSPMTILHQGETNKPNFFVTVERSGSSQRGNIHFYLSGSSGYKTGSINNEYLFDGNWAGLLLSRRTSTDVISTNNNYIVYVKKHKYGKLTTDASASISVNGGTESSYNAAWTNSTSESVLRVGYANNPDNTNYFSGSLQELRYWSTPLDAEDFANHVTSPSAYDGNSVSSSFQQLKFRLPLRQKFDLSTTSSFTSQHPNQSILNFSGSVPLSASFKNFTSKNSFFGVDETYYIENPSLGGNNLWSEKVRAESSTLTGFLNTDTRKEKSTYDTAPIDSPRLGIYFSPQNSINEDIFNQIGFFEIDDYIGAPDDVFKDDYPELKSLAYNYWQKYSDKNNINEYLRVIYQYDMSLFRQLDQLLPRRVKKMDGVLVEPNVLERSKDRIINEMTWEEPFYSMSLDQTDMNPAPTASFLLHEASMSLYPADNISGSYDTLPSAEISLSLAVNPAVYSVDSFYYGYSQALGFPVTASQESGVGQAWSNVGRITGSYDNSYASVNLSAVNPTSSILSAFNFSFDRNELPLSQSVEITGVEVTSHITTNRADRNKDHVVRLYDYNGLGNFGDNLATFEYTQINVTRSWGGSDKLWGVDTDTLRDVIYNGDAGLGVSFTFAYDVGSSATAEIDGVQLKIYYKIKKAEIPYYAAEGLTPTIMSSRTYPGVYGTVTHSISSSLNNPKTYYTTHETDWHYPSYAVSSGSSASLRSWYNINNVTSSTTTTSLTGDGLFASFSGSTTGAADSEYLFCANYGFNIPSESTVTGLSMGWLAKSEGSEILLTDDEFGFHISRSQAADIPASPYRYSSVYWETNTVRWAYGGDSNSTTGTIYTSPDNINNSDFGAYLKAATGGGGNRTGSLDTIGIKVFYKKPYYVDEESTVEFLPQGFSNSRYEGSKVTSADFNVDSPDTIDGGPVVEIRKANPNKFIVAPSGVSGSIKVL